MTVLLFVILVLDPPCRDQGERRPILMQRAFKRIRSALDNNILLVPARISLFANHVNRMLNTKPPMNNLDQAGALETLKDTIRQDPMMRQQVLIHT